jgi:hypothetical protein
LGESPPAAVSDAIVAGALRKDESRFTGGEILDRARSLVAEGKREQAITELEAAVRDRRWAQGRLWAELAALADTNDDLESIRRLWLDSPSHCLNNVQILRSVAHAAMETGDHEAARTLLQKAVALVVRRARRPRAVAKRAVARSTSWLPGRGVSSAPGDEGESWLGESDPERQETLIYFGLLTAAAARDGDEVGRLTDLLQSRSDVAG